jgi:hypothetical protein
MGVLGLSRYIETSNNDPRIFETIPTDSVILVDGVAFMIQILDRCSFRGSWPPQCGISRHLLQSFTYECFHRHLCDEINKMVHSYGLRVIVYFDAVASLTSTSIHSTMKSYTACSRREQKDRAWNSLYYQFEVSEEVRGPSGSRLWSSSQTPWPSLLQAQMKASLAALGVPHYSRDFPLHALLTQLSRGSSQLTPAQQVFSELVKLTLDLESANSIDTSRVDADCVMAFHCDYLNTKRGSSSESEAVSMRSFIYGRDSDFMVMKDCPYIEFGSLRFADGDCESGTGGHLQARVFRRAALSAALNLTENQFVEFCLLLGNDFCGHHPRLQMVHAQPRADNTDDGWAVARGSQQPRQIPPKLFSNVHSVHSIDMIRKWVRSAGGTGTGAVQSIGTGKKRQKGAGGRSRPTGGTVGEFACYSRTPAVMGSIRYCRAFYDHDLVALCQMDTVYELDDSGMTTHHVPPYYLTDAEGAEIVAMVSVLEHSLTGATLMGEWAIGCLELLTRQVIPSSMAPAAQSECVGEEGDVAGAAVGRRSSLDPELFLYRWNCVSARHLQVLRDMLLTIHAPSSQSNTPDLVQEAVLNLSWSDVVVGLLFEQVLRTLTGMQRDWLISSTASPTAFASCDCQPKSNMNWELYCKLVQL